MTPNTAYLLCPRRAEQGDMSMFNVPARDTWNERGSHLTCSWCGSLHPDEFMNRAEAGETLTPTDKNYKVYIGDHEKFYFQHLSEEQKTRFVVLMNTEDALRFNYPGHFYVTPFFAQLKPADPVSPPAKATK